MEDDNLFAPGKQLRLRYCRRSNVRSVVAGYIDCLKQSAKVIDLVAVASVFGDAIVPAMAMLACGAETHGETGSCHHAIKGSKSLPRRKVEEQVEVLVAHSTYCFQGLEEIDHH